MEELLAALHPKQSQFTYTHYMTPECLHKHLLSKQYPFIKEEKQRAEA